MSGAVVKIFVAPSGGVAMQAVEEIEAVAGRGLRGDRYSDRNGYWTGVDECEVTLIESECIEEIREKTGVSVTEGEHRRNLITQGIRLDSLLGKRFQVGTAILEYDRPRPPCGYIESLTEPGMTRALVGRGGICARIVASGTIRPNDSIVVL
ncbi:MAG: domain containing protein [Acidobacteria bacterium]|nr:domain containing protein [Acidobacteriota bacterium]